MRVIFTSSCATCSTRASVDRVELYPMDRCVYEQRERKGCHIHSELVRAFSLWYAPVPGCDKFRLVLPMFSCRYVDEIQKLSRPLKYATPFLRGLSRVDVAERLRRQTANLIPSGCAGSNPVINVLFSNVFVSLFSALITTSPLFLFFGEGLENWRTVHPLTRPLLCPCAWSCVLGACR